MAKVSSNMEQPMCENCSRLFNEDDFYYWCLPDEQMSFAMYHSYYWP